MVIWYAPPQGTPLATLQGSGGKEDGQGEGPYS